MRRLAAALLLLAPVPACLPLPVSGPVGPDAASAQEPSTLRLTASTRLRRQMQDAPGELTWSDLPGELEVEYVASDALPLERVPIRLVAVGVRDGEIVGRSATTPSVAADGRPSSASDLAGSGWPPAGEWFPARAWRPDGIASPAGAVPPNAQAAVSRVALPSDAGGVLIFASPAADELSKRFATLPVVITMRRTGGLPGPDTAPTDTTGG